jgi:hypothetical protein
MFENMSKVTNDHIKLVSILVKIYGFKNLLDYDTEISANTLEKNNDFLTEINKYTHKIDNLFPVHEINLRRVEYKIETEKFAMNVLRSMLTYVQIPWESKRTTNTVFVKLVPIDIQNNILNQIQEIENIIENTNEYEYIEINNILFNSISYDTFSIEISLNNSIPYTIDKLIITNKEFYGKKYSLTCGGNDICVGIIKKNTNLFFNNEFLPISYLKYNLCSIIIYDLDTFPEILNIKYRKHMTQYNCLHHGYEICYEPYKDTEEYTQKKCCPQLFINNWKVGDNYNNNIFTVFSGMGWLVRKMFKNKIDIDWKITGKFQTIEIDNISIPYIIYTNNKKLGGPVYDTILTSKFYQNYNFVHDSDKDYLLINTKYKITDGIYKIIENKLPDIMFNRDFLYTNFKLYTSQQKDAPELLIDTTYVLKGIWNETKKYYEFLGFDNKYYLQLPNTAIKNIRIKNIVELSIFSFDILRSKKFLKMRQDKSFPQTYNLLASHFAN